MPPVVSNLEEAMTNLSHLVDRAASGEEIVIVNNGVPLARLVPMELVTMATRAQLINGLARVAGV